MVVASASTVRNVLLGEDRRTTVLAVTAGITFAGCVAVLDLLLEPSSGFGIDWTGVFLDPGWVVFYCGLVLLTSVYSAASGGLLDCWLVPFVPLSISFVTFLSVAPHRSDPVPIWNWPAVYDLATLIGTAISGAILWSIALGTTSFAIGNLLKRGRRHTAGVPDETHR